MATKRRNIKNDDPYVALSDKIEKENAIFTQKQDEKHNVLEQKEQEKSKRKHDKQSKSETKTSENIVDSNAIPDIIVPIEVEKPIIKKNVKTIKKIEIDPEEAKNILSEAELTSDEISTYNPDINLSNKNISGILSILGADELIFGELEEEAKNLQIDLEALETPTQEKTEVEEEVIDEESKENQDNQVDDYDLNLGMLEEESSDSKREQNINHNAILKVIYSVFEKSKNLVALVKNDSIEYMNKNGIEYLEANSPEDIIGKQFFEFVAERDWNLLAENI